MNYQTSAIWFYKPFWLVVTALSILLLAATGFSAGFGSLLLAGLVYPVLVSLRIHRLRETGKVFSIEESSEWLVYVNGIPVREQRSILSNPCFTSTNQTRQFFTRAFLLKLAMQVFCIGILVNQAISGSVTAINAAAAGIILLALLYPLWRTLCALSALRAQTLQFETVVAQSGKIGFQGFFSHASSRKSALEALLAIA